jgi:hypothetical protein
LRLRAEDAGDLEVISAVMQDALISVTDLTYDRAQHRFTAVANRFRWEVRGNGENATPFERTLCALSFGAVERISYRGFRRRDEDRILSLLAVRVGGKPDTIDLEFSGGATLRLSVSTIQVHATDMGESWPTAWQPDHEAGEAR